MPPHSQNHSFLHSAEYTDIANARLHTKWCWVNANWLRRTQKYSENRHRIVWCCLHGFRTILETFSSFVCNFDFGHKTTDFVTAAISTGRRGRVCVCAAIFYMAMNGNGMPGWRRHHSIGSRLVVERRPIHLAITKLHTIWTMQIAHWSEPSILSSK